MNVLIDLAVANGGIKCKPAKSLGSKPTGQPGDQFAGPGEYTEEADELDISLKTRRRGIFLAKYR